MSTSKLKKGMYGLKQAALLAYQKLVNHLAPYGYHPLPFSLGLWTHKSRKTIFCLCVDDFGVKYFSKEDAAHLLSALRNKFEVTVDWDGKNYCGLDINWNYKDGWVEISMPRYIPKMLLKFNHPKYKTPQHAPHTWNVPAYGQKIQYAPEHDTSEKLDKKGTTLIQSITGSVLYQARALDPFSLVALTEIGTKQAKPTEATKKKTKMLLDYCATYPNTKIRYYASDMLLHVDSDAAYLVVEGAKSRIAGHYFLSSKNPTHNGPLHTLCRLLKTVVASAAEAETVGLFQNAQLVVFIRRCLIALGHPQPPTPIKTDNSTSAGFVNRKMRQKRSKSWDMKLYWLRDKENEKHFKVFWAPGNVNKADPFTKNHPPSHLRRIRSQYVVNLLRSKRPRKNLRKYISKILLKHGIARVC